MEDDNQNFNFFDVLCWCFDLKKIKFVKKDKTTKENDRKKLKKGISSVLFFLAILLIFGVPLVFLVLAGIGPGLIIGSLNPPNEVKQRNENIKDYNNRISIWNGEKDFINFLITRNIRIELRFCNKTTYCTNHETRLVHLQVEEELGVSSGVETKPYDTIAPLNHDKVWLLSDINSIQDKLYPGRDNIHLDDYIIRVRIIWEDEQGQDTYSSSIKVGMFDSDLEECFTEYKCDRCCAYRYGFSNICEEHIYSTCYHTDCRPCDPCGFRSDSCEILTKLYKICIKLPKRNDFSIGYEIKSCEGDENSVGMYEIVNKPFVQPFEFIIEAFSEDLLDIGELKVYEVENWDPETQLLYGGLLTGFVYGPCVILCILFIPFCVIGCVWCVKNAPASDSTEDDIEDMYIPSDQRKKQIFDEDIDSSGEGRRKSLTPIEFDEIEALSRVKNDTAD